MVDWGWVFLGSVTFVCSFKRISVLICNREPRVSDVLELGEWFMDVRAALAIRPPFFYSERR